MFRYYPYPQQTVIITLTIIIVPDTMVNHYTECNNISLSEATRKLPSGNSLGSLGNFPSRIDKSTLKISRMSQRSTFGILLNQQKCITGKEAARSIRYDILTLSAYHHHQCALWKLHCSKSVAICQILLRKYYCL